jgi:hypothetical protein
MTDYEKVAKNYPIANFYPAIPLIDDRSWIRVGQSGGWRCQGEHCQYQRQHDIASVTGHGAAFEYRVQS